MIKTISFDASNIITYEEFESHINSLKSWYQKEYDHIKYLYSQLLKDKEYEKSFSIIKEHNNLMITLLKKIIALFPLSDKKIGIYLSNSFARGTNLLDSDIDLNFMYEDPELMIYEELISSILYQVVGKYRDFVHDSISHRLTTLDEPIDKLTYVINFKDQSFTTKITTGNEPLMYKLFNTKKDISSFIKYYTEKLNDNEICEWIYFQKEIFSSPDYLNKLFSYIELHEKGTCHFKLLTYQQNILSALDQEISIIKEKSFNDIADIKKYYKNHAFKFIYETLTLLSKEKNIPSFKEVSEKLELISNKQTIKRIYKYFSLIMIFNYLCDEYGIEFRTRYSNKMTKEFISCVNNAYGSDFFADLQKELLTLYADLQSIISNIDTTSDLDTYIFNPEYEHINIANYSPLSHINNVSPCYRHDAYLLPFIKRDGKELPIHPDTLDDLNISREEVLYYKLVYPTSSTRTVYVLDDNICLKLATLRQITRSIRDVKNKELKRSEIAFNNLRQYSYLHFHLLEEKCLKQNEEIYNYIIRSMPNKRIYPWFYLIVSNRFSKQFMLDVIKNMVNIWMFYASKGIYFESAHTQNFLVDEDGEIYYRDLSDIRILDYEEMRPSYLPELKDEKELHSIFFDRSMLSQNIEHFITYRQDIADEDITWLQKMIINSINEYQVSFPDYSMNYDKNREGHHPIKVAKSRLR